MTTPADLEIIACDPHVPDDMRRAAALDLMRLRSPGYGGRIATGAPRQSRGLLFFAFSEGINRFRLRSICGRAVVWRNYEKSTYSAQAATGPNGEFVTIGQRYASTASACEAAARALEGPP